MGSDPNGEFFIIDSFIIGLFKGGLKEAFKRAGNDIKIWGGLFAIDGNKGFFGNIGEFVSRLTWQLPQTLGGLGTGLAHNTLGLRGGVESVKYKYGATVIQTREAGWGGVTQGSYILGDNSIRADANNSLFQHEYGHYIQSQAMGWGYYPRVGIPSSKSEGNHTLHPVEQDANMRAFLYFNKNIKNFYAKRGDVVQGRGWDFTENILNIDGTGNAGQYVDYKDDADKLKLKSLKVSPTFLDYFSWALPLPIYSAFQQGNSNARNYNGR